MDEILTKRGDDDAFIMSPKIDFAFKMLFGDPRNVELLIALLSAIIGIKKSSFKGLEIINSELHREFEDDRKGILDVRAKTIDGKQIDIEIQILPVIHMPARTLYYWSKMYAGQMKSGYDYDSLKKCITINIVDFKCLKIKKLHTVYHLSEDEAGGQLTDFMEVHFLELSKLNDPEVEQDPRSPVVSWLKFLAAKSRSAMEMLARDNEDINKAYENLKKISQDEKARMAYEAREAWLIDERSRIKEAREEGREEAIREVALKFIQSGMQADEVSRITGIPIERLRDNE